MYCAQACYHPYEIIELWKVTFFLVKRMEMIDHTQVPMYLSTHPSHAHRIENILKWIPEAMSRYEQSLC